MNWHEIRNRLQQLGILFYHNYLLDGKMVYFSKYIGTITIWSEDTRTAKEESSVHKDEVNLI